MDYSITDLKKIGNRIRHDIIDMVYSAGSGHPGGSLSVTDILTVLYFKEMSIDPENPDDPSRDRLVMSKGHASPGLYATLAERGFFPKSLLPGFRKLASKLEGHIHKGVPGVETSTGSLGQGLGVGVGLALAGRLDHRDYYVYVILGDGEIEEGSVWESMMAGSKYKLDHLIAVLDRNRVQLDGFTDDIMPMGDIFAKASSFGWNVIQINGHSYEEIISALETAKSHTGSPTFIIANTIKGKGVSYMENTAKYHGAPPASKEEFDRAMMELDSEVLQ